MTNGIQKTKELKKIILSVDPDIKAYLFGSYAVNKAKPWSDIDVAIISDKFDDYWQDKKEISALAARVDDNFEIHLFKPSDFENPYDPLVNEIKKYGILV